MLQAKIHISIPIYAPRLKPWAMLLNLLSKILLFNPRLKPWAILQNIYSKYYSMKLLFIVLITCTGFCSAQTIQRSVMGSGGGTSTNGTNSIRGTVSQTAIGRIAQSPSAHSAGFWYNASQMIQSSGFGSLVTIPTIEAEIGETVKVPLILQQSSHLFETSARSFTAIITFNASLLEPVGNKFTYKRTGSTGELTITGTVKDTAGILAEMEFTAKLGNAEKTPLSIQSFLWNETNRVKILTKDGGVNLIGICNEGDTVRLIKRTTSAALINAYPNPADNYTTIEYILSERGETSMYLMDVQGKIVTILYKLPSVIPGHYSFDADIEYVPSGSYFLILKTPSEMFSKRFLIER